TKTIGACDEAIFFALYCAIRSEELGMQAWDAPLRDQILRMQFAAQSSGYRQQYPGIIEQFILRDEQAIGWIMVSHDAEIRCIDLAILPEERRRGAATRVLRDLQEQAAARTIPV